jgi:hypothetical protein
MHVCVDGTDPANVPTLLCLQAAGDSDGKDPNYNKRDLKF